MKHYSLHPLRGHGLHFKTHHSDTLRSNMAQRTDQTEWMNPAAFIWAIYSHPSLSVWSVGNRGDWLIYPSSSSSVGSGAREKAERAVQTETRLWESPQWKTIWHQSEWQRGVARYSSLWVWIKDLKCAHVHKEESKRNSLMTNKYHCFTVMSFYITDCWLLYIWILV